MVDDEAQVLDNLSESISWPQFGIETVLRASDGIEALECLKQHPVDLLITDVRMPRMNGFELLHRVHEQYPAIHCILLTAYSEFEYAREAIALGVENYLLKPLQSNELEATIEKALDNIYRSRSAIFRDNILLRWVEGTIGTEELAERANLLNINIYQSSYCAAVLESPKANSLLAAYAAECADTFENGIEAFGFWAERDKGNNRFVFIIGGKNLNRNILESQFYQAALRLNLAGRVRAGIGDIVSDAAELPLSYRKAIVKTTKSENENSGHILNSLSPVVRQTLNYINSNYAEGVSIKEFCALHNMSPAYVGWLFKKETGIFFNTYLMEFRIQRATELLRDGGERINEVAALTGFSSPSYFISCFKRSVGLSPVKYRETIEKQMRPV
jgi:two-component system response regulator YesN